MKKHLQLSQTFPNIEETLKNFSVSMSDAMHRWERFNKLHGILVECIESSEQQFVMGSVLHFMALCEKFNLVDQYKVKHFEKWLSDQRGMDEERKTLIRAKIVGMHLPRDAYQVLFPIANQKKFTGPHIVLAHRSPDLDTIISSFWGWMDAFGAEVSEGVHLWNVPNHMSCHDFEIEHLFHAVFKEDVFKRIASRHYTPMVSGFDLMSVNDMHLRLLKHVSYGFHEEREEVINVVVDNQGIFQGDWRGIDVENVRQMVNYLMILLRSREHDIYETLIKGFQQSDIDVSILNQQLQFLLNETIHSQKVMEEMSLKQQIFFNRFLERVLLLDLGLGTSFVDFFKSIDAQSIASFTSLISKLTLDKSLESASREELFSFVKDIVHSLREGVRALGKHLDTLKIATDIKREVFQHLPHSLDVESDFELIKSQLGSYPSITLHVSDEHGKKIPVGVVHQHAAMQSVIGTVSLRDFSDNSNYIPPMLNVVSIIDHHKSSYSTSIPAMTQVGDVQSTAVILAEIKMAIYDKYGSSGYDAVSIKQQIGSLSGDYSQTSLRKMQRLIQKQALEETGSLFYVSPQREALEYTHYIYAILDDTDLLTKVTYRDVDCVRNLLNRLNSLEEKREVEVVAFDEIKEDDTFVSKAAALLLSNEYLYKMYAKNQKQKESIIQQQIIDVCEKGDDAFFKDTKILSGYASVGQSKIFPKAASSIQSQQSKLLDRWVDWCKKKYTENSIVNLYLHMISTIPDAERVYTQNGEPYRHKDSLWVWIPDDETSWSHAECFFREFFVEVKRMSSLFSLEIKGKYALKLKDILSVEYPSISIKAREGEGETTVVCSFGAAMLNSRKARIAPYLS